MSTGASNLSGERIPFFERSYVPRASGIFEGAVVVATSDDDNLIVDLPNSSAALNGGRNFVGINAGAGSTVVSSSTLPSDLRLPVQKAGVAKCALKASTACQKYAPAGYNPADGGHVVPHVSGVTIYIGRFTQSKSSSSAVQYVGVWLDGGSPLAEQLLGAITSSSSTITDTATETAFDQTLSIAANTLSAGSVIRILAKVSVPSGNGTNTLTLRLKIGSQVLALTGAIDVTDGGGDVGVLQAELTVRSIGSSGVFTAAGSAGLGVPSTATMRVGGVASTFTLNTTAALTLSVTAQWSAASTSNQAVLDQLAWSLLRSGV